MVECILTEIQGFYDTCCLLLNTCARCFPTSAERFRQTHQGLSMTLAAASREAGQVRAATIPAQCDGVKEINSVLSIEATKGHG